MSWPSPWYTVLKDFAVPLTALAWGIHIWWRDNSRVLSISQIGSSITSRVSEVDGQHTTTFALDEIIITNDSPKANIVIARYDVKPVYMLQWSRDSTVAETTRSARTSRCIASLQWSRDSTVAETGPNLATRLDRVSLQWSRDSTVAETQFTYPATPVNCVLQWSRDSTAAETSAESLIRRVRKQASMEPRLHSRGTATL